MKKINNLRVWSKYLRPITFSNFVDRIIKRAQDITRSLIVLHLL